jgi:hypothetical protein
MLIGLRRGGNVLRVLQIVDRRHKNVTAVAHTLDPRHALSIRRDRYLPHRAPAIQTRQDLIDVRAVKGSRRRGLRLNPHIDEDSCHANQNKEHDRR